MPSLGSSERTLIRASLVNGGLGAAAGGLAGGITGVQIGLIAGVLLAVLPVALHLLSGWLARPDALPRFIGHEIGATAVRAAALVVMPAARALDALSRWLEVPALLLRFLADVLLSAGRAATSAIWGVVSTPLGLANLAALAAIAVNLTRFDFAGPVAFLGLGMLILMLLVNENERRDAANADE
ncbi:MAG: hypothetical protein ACOY4R_19350 [Pseudomonadota bacterium]